MSKSLESVLRFRRHTLQQRQATLAQAIAADAELRAEQDRRDAARGAVAAEVAAGSRSGPVDVAAMSSRLLYAGQMKAQHAAIASQRQLVAEQIALCRRAVAKADADVKAIERLLEKRAAEAKRIHARRTQHALEDRHAGRTVNRSTP